MEHQQPQTPPTTTHPVGSHPPPGTSKSTQQMPSPTPRQRMQPHRHRMRPHQTRRQPQPRQPAMALTRMPQSQNRPRNTRTQPPTKNNQTTPKRTPSRPTRLTKTPWGSTLRIARYKPPDSTSKDTYGTEGWFCGFHCFWTDCRERPSVGLFFVFLGLFWLVCGCPVWLFLPMSRYLLSMSRYSLNR